MYKQIHKKKKNLKQNAISFQLYAKRNYSLCGAGKRLTDSKSSAVPVFILTKEHINNVAHKCVCKGFWTTKEVHD